MEHLQRISTLVNGQLRSDELTGRTFFSPHDTADVQAVMRYLYAQAREGMPVPSLTIPEVGGDIILEGAMHMSKVPDLRQKAVDSLRVILASGDEVAIRPLDGIELRGKQHHQTFEGHMYRELERIAPEYIGELPLLFLLAHETLGIVTDITFREGKGITSAPIPVPVKIKHLFDPYSYLNP